MNYVNPTSEGLPQNIGPSKFVVCRNERQTHTLLQRTLKALFNLSSLTFSLTQNMVYNYNKPFLFFVFPTLTLWYLIEPFWTTLKIMNFNSILPHLNYLNAGWVFCTISPYLTRKHENCGRYSLSPSLSLALSLSLSLSLSLNRGAHSLFRLTEDKFSFETDIIQFF